MKGWYYSNHPDFFMVLFLEENKWLCLNKDGTYKENENLDNVKLSKAPSFKNFLDDPMFITMAIEKRKKFAKARCIVEHGIPKLKNLGNVCPELFESERNKQFIMKAIEEDDYEAIVTFIKAYRPLYEVRKSGF